MTATSPAATGPRPIGPPLAGTQCSPRMARPSICCGRTYDIWSGFWPKAPSSPMADRLNAATKYVATHRPESPEWGPFEGLGPDIVEGIRRIKSQDGRNLILSGSSTLTSTPLEHGLADEVLLAVYPLLLGTGKRLFAREPRRAHSSSSARKQCRPASSLVVTGSLGL